MKKKQNSRSVSESRPALAFTPYAWAKLVFFRDCGETEIGGFGITSKASPLLVTDFVTVSQETTPCSVCFDDEAVADFFEDQVDAGRTPAEFGRIWLHTHPGESPTPSGTDEQTFARVFGRCDWSVMFIMARDGKCYARLHFSAGPEGDVMLLVKQDFASPFPAADHEGWGCEFLANIHPVEWTGLPRRIWDPLGDWDDIEMDDGWPEDIGQGEVACVPEELRGGFAELMTEEEDYDD